MHFTTTTLVALLASAANAAVITKPLASRALTAPLKTGPRIEWHPVAKRATSDTSLQQEQNWYWGVSGNPNAELTCTSKGDDERLLAMESFADQLQSTTCSNGQINFKFSSQSAFNAAQRNWAWVNQASGHYIFLVTDAQSCAVSSPSQANNTIPGTGTSAPRQPYKVTDAKFNSGSLTATLTGQAQTWEQAIGHNWHLRGSTQGLPSSDVLNTQVAGANSTLGRRDTHSISLAADFSKQIATKDIGGGLSASLNCKDCNARGSVNIDIEVSGKFGIPPIEGTLSISPAGLGASVSVELAVGGALTDELSAELVLLDIPLPGGFAVAGLLDFGPQLVVQASAGITEVSAEASISVGVDISIPDDSVATVDFDDSSNNNFNGWNPSFSPIGPDVSASVSVSGSAGPSVSLQLAATIVGKGFGAGLVLAAPTLDFNLAAQADSNGVCGGTDPVGIEFDVGIGASLDGFGGFGDVKDFPNEFTIFATSTALFSTCIGIGGGSGGSTVATASSAAGTNTADCQGSFGGVCGTIAASAAGAASTSSSPAVAPSAGASVAPSAAPVASAAASGAASVAPAGSSAAPVVTSAAAASGAASAAASVAADPSAAAASVAVSSAPAVAAASAPVSASAPAAASSAVVARRAFTA